MGHGASSTAKNTPIRINFPVDGEESPWNRSNSDGCILETLTTSKTKVDLLEHQIDEYRDLLGIAEENYNQAQREADRFKKQLAAAESSNLELLDRIEMMDDELTELRRQTEINSSTQMSRTLIEKDHEIDRLQAIVEKLTKDIKIVKSKSREKVKTLKSSLLEYKQENSLKIYQLNEQIKVLEDDNRVLQTEKSRCSSHCNNPEATTEADVTLDVDPRNLLIVELSSQVHQQEQIIEDLREKLRLDLLQTEDTTQQSRSYSAREKRQMRKKGSSSDKRSSSGYSRVNLDRNYSEHGTGRMEENIVSDHVGGEGLPLDRRKPRNKSRGTSSKQDSSRSKRTERGWTLSGNNYETDSHFEGSTLTNEISASNV